MTTHTVIAELPLKIVSEANQRECWQVVSRRKKAHRDTARYILQKHARPMNGGAVTVTLKRIGARLLDSDNLQSGFKAVRDGVADWLGIDDGSPRMTWRYEQEIGKRGVWFATVKAEWET